MSGKATDGIRKENPPGIQYLAFPGTKEDRAAPNTFERRRSWAGSWEMATRFALLLINICIIQENNAKSKGILKFG